MTKKELLAKNEAIRLARELKKQQLLKAEEGKREEKPEEVLEKTENKKQPRKKGGKKPANREYMVVEQDGILEEGIETEEKEETEEEPENLENIEQE